MPEFPEVFTITKDLKRIASGKIISKVDVHGDYKVLPNNKIFKENVEKQKIMQIKQVAKNIVISLKNEKYINIHLGMSGQILAKKKDKHLRWERVTFTLTQENRKKKLFLAYRSIRKFGKVELLNKSEFKNLKAKYGPNPLENRLTSEKFYKIINSKKTNIKNLLMDQGKIGGLGNIYATEALFLAGIHPKTRTKNIPPEASKKLLTAVKKIIREGIENRGSTLSDDQYKDIFGKRGSQQESFRVYGKEICFECGATIEKKKISGRNTYFCPKCQIEIKEKDIFDNS